VSDLFETGNKPSEDQEIQLRREAKEHFEVTLLGGKVRLREFGSIAYPKGWYGLIETLMDEINRFPIELERVIEEFGELDVSFIPLTKTQEVKVWRAIDKARRESINTCMYCGGIGHRRIPDKNDQHS